VGHTKLPAQHEDIKNTESQEESKKEESKTRVTTFQEFNRRLDSLKAKVMGDEKAWRRLNKDTGGTENVASA